jgi:hypothetical protein
MGIANIDVVEGLVGSADTDVHMRWKTCAERDHPEPLAS